MKSHHLTIAAVLLLLPGCPKPPPDETEPPGTSHVSSADAISQTPVLSQKELAAIARFKDAEVQKGKGEAFLKAFLALSATHKEGNPRVILVFSHAMAMMHPGSLAGIRLGEHYMRLISSYEPLRQRLASYYDSLSSGNPELSERRRMAFLRFTASCYRDFVWNNEHGRFIHPTNK